MKNLKTVILKGKEACNQRPEPQTEMNQIQDSSQGYINVQGMAEYLAIKPSTLYALVERRKVPFYKVGRLIRFKRSEIDEWMAGQKEPVVDARVEARKVISSLQKKPCLDVDRIVKKAIEEAGKKGYTSQHGKPDQSKGLREEVEHGTV